MKRYGLVLVLFLFFGLPLMAQNFGQGFIPFESYDTQGFDNVNLYNLNLIEHVPIISYPQRGQLHNLSLSAVYNTPIWGSFCVWTGYGTNCYYTPVYLEGMTLVRDDVKTMNASDITTGGDGYPYFYYASDSSAAVHEMGWTGTNSVESFDGTGLLFNTSSNTLTDRDGISYSFAFGSPTFGDGIQDLHGNTITTNYSGGYYSLTDSVGRSIPIPVAMQFPVSSAGCQTVYFPGPGGGTATYEFCYSAISISYPSSGIIIGYTGTAYLLTSIVLPNSTSWTFAYDAEGYLTSVTLPTGGSVTYTTSGGQITARAIYDGTSSKTWSYGFGTGTNVTDPSGDVTVHTFGYSTYYETQTQYYDNASNLKKTVNMTYSSPGTDPFAYITGASVNYGVTLEKVETTWPTGGQVSQVCTIYDDNTNTGCSGSDAYSSSGPTIYDANVGTTPTYPLVYGSPIYRYEYDYASSSPGSVRRETATDYEWLHSSNYLSRNLLNLPYSVNVYDGSSTLAGKTTYAYDESGSSYCSSSSPCGDLTTINNYYSGSSATTAHTHYSSYGMPTVQIDGNSNSTSYTYDGTNAYLYEVQYPDTLQNSITYHHIDYYAFDFDTGLMTSQTDQNSQTTSYGYDSSRRLTSVSYPDGGSDSYAYTDTTPKPYFDFTKAIASGVNFVERGTADGLGREIQTRTTVPTTTCSGGYAYVNITYDGEARKNFVSNSDCSSSVSTGTSYAYDPLNRVTTVTEADTSTITYSYADSSSLHALCTTITDEASKVRKTCADGLGRMTTAWEDPGTSNYETAYTYDPLDNLTGVTQGAQTRTFNYDFLSRLTSAGNPEESYATTYTYDANGNVLTRTDANGVVITWTYDGLNRFTVKSYSNGMAAVLPVYDLNNPFSLSATNTLGRLVALWQSDLVTLSWQAFSYDAMGRLTTQWDCLTEAYPYCNLLSPTNATYDLAGDMASLTYPSGRKVTFTPNIDMQPYTTRFDSLDGTSVGYNFLSSAAYSPLGGPTSLTLGSGAIEANTFNNRLQLTGRTLTSGSNTWLNLGFAYNSAGSNNGNVTAITDSRNTARSQTFTYDNLNRIASAASSTYSTSPTYCYGESYTTDRYGNLSGISSVGSGYSGCTQDSLSLSISSSTNRITTSGFTYDSNGNLLTDGFNTLTYDAENRITSDSNSVAGSTNYSYTASGTRGQKIQSGSTTNYVNFGGNTIAEFDIGGAVQAEYVYTGNRLLASMGEAQNGGFEQGSSGWSLTTGASVVTNASNAHSGSNYLQISTSTGSDAALSPVPVSVGEVITFGGWTYLQSGSASAVGWWLEAADSSHTPVNYIAASPSTVSAGSWTYQIATYTIPSGVAYVNLYSQVYSPSTATVARFDDGFVSAGTQYYHQDHLGSTRLITDSSGSDITELGYFPYGRLWYQTATATKWQFTGKERDSESGLDNFGARYDSSQYGRFMTPDPSNLSVDFWMPQTWNRYSYALNNPLSMVDRNGQWPTFWHDEIYEEALPGLGHDAMQLLEDASETVDTRPGGQDPENAFLHGMRNGNDGETVDQAEQDSDDSIAANQHNAQDIEAAWLKSGHSGIAPAALTAFANVAHNLSDRRSPTHRGFQRWRGTKGIKNKLLALFHVSGELVPTPSEFQQSVQDVQNAFNQTFSQFGFDSFTFMDLIQNQPQFCTSATDSSGNTVSGCD